MGITNAWRDQDTTDMKISIDHADFSDYCDRMSMLYHHTKEMLANKTYMVMDYEDFHSAVETDWDKLVKLQKCLKTGLTLGLEIDIDRFRTVAAREEFMAKQDKNDKHKDKIQHYKAFKEFVKGKIASDPGLISYVRLI